MSEPKLCKAYSQYGASMGRIDNITEKNHPVKFKLYRVSIDCGGYDNGGAYWGNGGGRLYRAYGDGEEFIQEMFFRAFNREDAKQQVLYIYPQASFYK